MTTCWAETPGFVTYSGQAMAILEPRPEQIKLIDIAHHLARVCRFGGACNTFYSVADHSVYVSLHVPSHLQKRALLHDAAEAYLGDIISPLKALLPDYQAIEEIWEGVIATAFDLPCLSHPAIKRADLAAVQSERSLLLPKTLIPGEANDLWEAFTAKTSRECGQLSIAPSPTPQVAQERFLHQAQVLGL